MLNFGSETDSNSLNLEMKQSEIEELGQNHPNWIECMKTFTFKSSKM
jgi:hypothetical protein